MKYYYLLIIVGDVEPELRGPFENELARDQAAKEYRGQDDEFPDGVFLMQTDSQIKPEIDTLAGDFFFGDDE